MRFLFVRPEICPWLVCSHIRLPSDSTSRWTPLPSAISFPLPGGFGTLTLKKRAPPGALSKEKNHDSSFPISQKFTEQQKILLHFSFCLPKNTDKNPCIFLTFLEVQCELPRLIEVGASCFFDPGYCHTANWQFSQNLRKRLCSARSRPTILLFFMLPVSAYLRF